MRAARVRLQRCGAARLGKRVQHALFHFTRGLAREGDGKDLLRPLTLASSTRILWMSSSVLPDPAGACTMNERDGSSARIRAS